MKILSIGNSFSQDAHRWLYKLAKLNGIELETANLYIGGCSLETHFKNLEENNAFYSFELNGNPGTSFISIDEALKSDDWDVVTLQQVSLLSGMFETYEPYLSVLASAVRKIKPNAKLYFHQTWAYETDSTHRGFENYNNDQAEMYRRVKQTAFKAAAPVNASIIPTGDVIQALRETVPEFNYSKGGLSLCRDGFHLTFDYGRFAAAATWLKTLSGNKVNADSFEDFNPDLLKKITDLVNEL